MTTLTSPGGERALNDTAILDADSQRLAFLAGGGEMGERIRSFDWAATPLGSPAAWPQSLKTTVRIMLTSRQPIWVGWGPELIYLYNDAYKSIIGGKHPWALGRPTKIVWQEIWGDIGPMLAHAMGGVEGTYVEKQLLIMERNGYPEETYYTFSYSPVPDDDGTAGGIICANTEDTGRVIGERQLATLRELAAKTVDARTWEDVADRSVASLRADRRDLPFAMLFLRAADGGDFALVGDCGIDPADPLCAASAWPLAAVLEGHEPVVVEDLAARFAAIPTGAWERPPHAAVVLPIPPSGDTGRAGGLVVGLNPFRLFDEPYRGFLGLVAGQIAAAIAGAQAYEDERRRAEALAELDRAKTVFFSNISHEFRTPLTLMLGPLEDVLDRDGMPADERALVGVAHANGLRLLKLVNTLLDFSRIEAGRVQASFRPTDLSVFTAELASSFQSATDRAGLTLMIDAPPLPEPVFVDRDMWEKVVLNLVSNAFKFTFEGAIFITVHPSADGNAAEVSVADTGTGIPADALPRLFERFHRVEGARGRSFEGSGIGLALVQELVRLHGGDVRVDSTLGQGTMFTVALPFGTAHLPAERIGAEAPAGVIGRANVFVEEALRWVPGADPSGGGAATLESAAPVSPPVALGRVLLADDNADMRGYVTRLLAAEGFEVEAVTDGFAAIDAARRARPDLILSDVMMPRLDGFGLLAALGREPTLSDVPVILLSARAGEEARIEGLAAGAEDYLIKPFSARELVARVGASLKVARVRRVSEAALREETRTLETLNRTGAALASELDLERVVQMVTDAGVELTGAHFGAFFYNVENAAGESYMLYTLSGVERAHFENFPMPRNTKVFAPTFRGEAVVRSDDILADARYGHNAPHRGMPEGHLPVRSYLAVPVISRSGEVIGGLFFGHPEPGRFSDRHERLMAGIAAEAAVAMDNARLYRAAQREIEERRQTEAALQRTEEALREAAERVELALDAGAIVGTWMFDVPQDRVIGDERFARTFGVDADEARAGIRLDVVTGSIHPDDRERVQREIGASIARGGPYRAEYRVRRTDGVYRWIEASGRCEHDAHGRPSRFPGVLIDIDERRTAEEQLREREADLEILLNSTADGFYAVDRDGIAIRCNAAFLRMLGFADASEVVGRDIHALIHHSHADGTPYSRSECPVYRTATTGEPAHVVDEPFFRRDGTSFPVEYWVRPVIRDDILTGAVCNFIDISERKRGEEARQLLMRELNHRVKNLFSITAGMVNMTARASETPREMASALTGRLLALSKAHELIRAAIAPDADGGTSAQLRDLVVAVVTPHLSDTHRLSVDGSPQEIGPTAATSFALVLHELATNAAKYGALSAPGGRLDIAWAREGDRLLLHWTESGGPAVAGPPQREGFGSQLARMSARGQLGGDIAFDWRPDGAAIHLTVAAERIPR